MAEFPNYEKLANVVAEKALDEYLYEGKTIREWIKIIAEQESKADGDCISREVAIDAIEKYKMQPGKLSPIETAFNDGIETAKAEIGHNVPSINSQEPKTEWIPVKTRSMTEEETEHYFEYTDMRIDDTYTILDCPLPDDGQEVLISRGGYVGIDVFIRDSEGCYFEGVDIDEVEAWMPLPEPYKEG